MPDHARDKLTRVTLDLCTLCMSGAGGECHTPGCSLWLCRAPDLPIDWSRIRPVAPPTDDLIKQAAKILSGPDAPSHGAGVVALAMRMVDAGWRPPVQQDTDPSPAELGFVRMMTRLREVVDRPRLPGELPMVNAKQILDLGDPYGLWSTSFVEEVGADDARADAILAAGYPATCDHPGQGTVEVNELIYWACLRCGENFGRATPVQQDLHTPTCGCEEPDV